MLLTDSERALIPEGFTVHEGGDCPLGHDAFVEALIRTADGIGSAGITRARYHLWPASEHSGGIGAVVGYRLANPGDKPQLPLLVRLR